LSDCTISPPQLTVGVTEASEDDDKFKVDNLVSESGIEIALVLLRGTGALYKLSDCAALANDEPLLVVVSVLNGPVIIDIFLLTPIK
jgi:hypothetical protein